MYLRRQVQGDGASVQADDGDAAWLDAFDRGDRKVMERCYREHFETVEAAIGSILGGADRGPSLTSCSCGCSPARTCGGRFRADR